MKGYCHVSFSIQDFEQQAVLFVHFRQIVPFNLTGTACLVTQTIYNLILLQCFKYSWYAFVSITYRVIQEEAAILWEMIVCVILSKKVHMNMGPILNGYRDMVKRRYGPSCEHEQQLRNK